MHGLGTVWLHAEAGAWLTQPDGDEAEEVSPAIPACCSPPSLATGGDAAAYLCAQAPKHHHFSPS